MASFTIELWRVLELYPEDPVTYENIGLAGYPLFDEPYRAGLTKKIVDHFYNREIGQETVEMFRFAMKRKMNEIMPLYNQFYESERLTFDPFKTVDMRTVSTGESATTAEAQGGSSNSSTGEAHGRQVGSNMPQMLLAGDKDYASTAADANSTSANTASSSETSNSNTEENTSNTSEMTGYQGLPSEMLMAFRATLLNIDMMIIGELEEMFMSVWNTGDEYTRRNGNWYY